MATTLNLHRKGAVGFIDWLDGAHSSSRAHGEKENKDGESEEDEIEDQKSAQKATECDRASVWQGLILSSPHKAKESNGVEHSAVKEDDGPSQMLPSAVMQLAKTRKKHLLRNKTANAADHEHKEQGEVKRVHTI